MSMLTEAAGWIALAALFLAPWAFGSRPYLWNGLLATALLTAGLLWIAGLRDDQRRPNIPTWCLICVIALNALLWTSLLNSRSFYDTATDQLVPLSSTIAFLPSTVDRSNSLLPAVSLSAMLIALLVFADLSAFQAWRHRFLRGMAFSGIAVIAAGLVLKAGAFASLNGFLERRPWASGDIFGPLDYHGNAGTFINLVLPALATQAAAAFGLTWRAFWLAGLALAVIAALVNTSRVGLVLTIASLPVAVWIIALGWRQSPSIVGSVSGATGTVALLALLVLAAALLVIHTGSKSLERFSSLGREISVPWYPRYQQNLAAWKMAGEHPWFGSGIGSYRLLVQHSRIRGTFYAPAFHPGQPYTVLSNTHNDYLQTLVEWGWSGLAAWAALVGAIATALVSSLRKASAPESGLIAASVALATVYLHAIVDCPLQIPCLHLYIVAFLGLAAAMPLTSAPHFQQ